MTTTRRWASWEATFLILIALIFANFGSSSSEQVPSGGIWFSSSSEYDAQFYNYNFTQALSTFPVDQIQFLINAKEINFIYYSLYNATSQKNEIFRARPDGSNTQYITTSNSLHDDPYGRKGVVKFGIDLDNGYLYYTYGTMLYQSLLTGVNPVIFSNYAPNIPTSVVYNTNQKNSWSDYKRFILNSL